MPKVRGIYDGQHVRLLEPVTIAPDTEVEVLIPAAQSAAPASPADADPEERREEAFLQHLVELGIITRAARPPEEWDDSFEPIPNPGEPISDTILRERR